MKKAVLRFIIISGWFLLVLIMNSCVKTERMNMDNDDKEAIRQARIASNKAIEAKDTTALSAIWTEDYHVITSRNFEGAGREANRKRFAAEFASRPDVTYVRTTEEIELFLPWDMAAEHGVWTGQWTDGNEKIKLSGSYYAKWHKIDGRWMIRAEIFTPLTCTGGKFCEQSPFQQ